MKRGVARGREKVEKAVAQWPGILCSVPHREEGTTGRKREQTDF